MKNTRKKPLPWRSWLISALFLLMGGFCGSLIARHIFSSEGPGRGPGGLIAFGLTILGFCAILFLQIIIHEAGHLVFGLLSGYRFSSFRAGSLMVVKTEEKLRLKRLSLAGTGGQCLMDPPELVDGRMPFVLYNLGGSLLNLLSALLFLGLYRLTQGLPYLPLFCLMAAIVGLAYALLNGIPLKLGPVNNDGHNALSMGREPAALFSFWVQLKLSARMAQGQRLRDMPEDWFQVPGEAGMKNSMTAVLGVFACNRLMDTHQFQQARALMEKLLTADTAMVGLYENLMICDLIYCELLFENRRDRLARMLSRGQRKFMKTMKTYPAVLRTQYAWALLAERDEEKAAKLLARFEKIGAAYPYPGEWAGERELIQLVRARALESL